MAGTDALKNIIDYVSHENADGEGMVTCCKCGKVYTTVSNWKDTSCCN